jgi:probable HAF family extracellular repeat protein
MHVIDSFPIGGIRRDYMTKKPNVSGVTQLEIEAQPADAHRQNTRQGLIGPHSFLRLQRDLATIRLRAPKPGVANASMAHTLAAKTYSFTTVDYPGAAFTEVLGSNDTTDVGVFNVDPTTVANLSFAHSGNEYQIVNVPGSSSALVFAINGNGAMAGAYTDAANKLHGFVMDAGTVTTIDFPGAVQTAIIDVNDAGDTAGFWIDAANNTHGFIGQSGVFTPIDKAGATSTEVTGINASGQVAGIWEDASSVSHGFVWSNGVFTNIDVPGASATTPFGITDSGELGGYYIDASSAMHGFVYQNSFSVIDIAGAASTLVVRLSNEGKLAGVFVDALNESHGFTAH